VIKNLIIINSLVWLAQITIGQDLIPMENLFALHHFSSAHYGFWQFITYMFLHSSSSFFHILFNMFALWMFGSTLENLWGPGRFLIFYLIGLKIPDHGLKIIDHGLKITDQYWKITIFSLL
jgi:membrane associated rhomboid family serine protease